MDGLYSSEFTTANPTFAYVHYDSLHTLRRRHVNSSRKRRFNAPIAQLERNKLRRIQPHRKEEDPYIMAILIAMAQEQQWLWTQRTKPKERVGRNAAAEGSMLVGTESSIRQEPVDKPDQAPSSFQVLPANPLARAPPRTYTFLIFSKIGQPDCQPRLRCSMHLDVHSNHPRHFSRQIRRAIEVLF